MDDNYKDWKAADDGLIGRTCRHQDSPPGPSHDMIYQGDYGCGRLSCAWCEDGFVFCTPADRNTGSLRPNGGHYKLTHLLFEPETEGKV